jgi:hypothetical protein
MVLSLGCQGEVGHDDEGGGNQAGTTRNRSTISACPVDPDCGIGGDCSLYVCPDYWQCEDLASGGKRCVSQWPAYPTEDGDWTCAHEDGRTVCTGTEVPADGGGGDWHCLKEEHRVVCEKTPDYPTVESSGGWVCSYDGDARVCETPGGSGTWECAQTTAGPECRRTHDVFPDDGEWQCVLGVGDDGGAQIVCAGVPGDGGGPDWVCEQGEFTQVCERDFEYPEYPGDGGGPLTNCEMVDEFRIICRGTPPTNGGGKCIIGQQRWCDDAMYCSWGKQECLEATGDWGPCIEPTLTAAGLTDRPDTACGCRYFYFNAECCETPDCIIPADHQPPTCTDERNGGLCAYCDSHADCGGEADLCVFSGNGTTFCGTACGPGGSCPEGFECSAIATRQGAVQQCVPSGGACGG